MLPTIPLAEAKNHLSQLIARIEQGEEVAITRHGKAVARLAPMPAAPDSDQPAHVATLFDQLRSLRCPQDIGGDLKAIARDGLD